MSLIKDITFLTHKINVLENFIILIKKTPQCYVREVLLSLKFIFDCRIIQSLENNENIAIIMKLIIRYDRLSNCLDNNLESTELILILTNRIKKLQHQLNLLNYKSAVISAEKYGVSRPRSPFLISDLTDETLEFVKI